MGKTPDYIGEGTTTEGDNTTDPSQPTDTSAEAPTEPVGKKGCKSVLALPALVTLLAAGILLRRRDDGHI